MVRRPSLPQEAINLIDEDNSGLEFVSEAKPEEPLAHEIGYPDVDEDCAGLLGDGLCEHGLSGPRRALEERGDWSQNHILRRGDWSQNQVLDWRGRAGLDLD